MMFTTKVPMTIGGALVITYKDRQKERRREAKQQLGDVLLEAGGIK